MSIKKLQYSTSEELIMIKDKNLRKFVEIISENEFFFEEDSTFGGFLVKLHVIIKAIDELSDDNVR